MNQITHTPPNQAPVTYRREFSSHHPPLHLLAIYQTPEKKGLTPSITNGNYNQLHIKSTTSKTSQKKNQSNGNILPPWSNSSLAFPPQSVVPQPARPITPMGGGEIFSSSLTALIAIGLINIKHYYYFFLLIFNFYIQGRKTWSLSSTGPTNCHISIRSSTGIDSSSKIASNCKWRAWSMCIASSPLSCKINFRFSWIRFKNCLINRRDK